MAWIGWIGWPTIPEWHRFDFARPADIAAAIDPKATITPLQAVIEVG